MFGLKKTEFKKIGRFFRKLPKYLGENAFLTSLEFIFISLILGTLLFYKYSILPERKEPRVLEKSLLFDEKNFQEFLKTWQERQKKLEEVESKTYFHPFRKI